MNTSLNSTTTVQNLDMTIRSSFKNHLLKNLTFNTTLVPDAHHDDLIFLCIRKCSPHEQSSYHLSLYKITTISLTTFPILYIISPWCIYFWSNKLLKIAYASVYRLTWGKHHKSMEKEKNIQQMTLEKLLINLKASDSLSNFHCSHLPKSFVCS